MKNNDNTMHPRYVISIAAKMLGVQTYKLRYYESVGVISPSRSDGNIRLYSEDDIERLRRAIRLSDELGINMAGVEVIFNLLNRIEELQKDNDALQQKVSKLTKENTHLKKFIVDNQ
ncbi:MAG: helix-turn-helix transcriptional regulator [Chloroflexi bacterium]|nr:helix-turn-helix transcriptional regulator [Chloroflexota bacterium]